MRVKIGGLDSDKDSLLMGLCGTGDSDNVVELSLPEEIANSVGGVLGCGAGKVENHAGLDVLDYSVLHLLETKIEIRLRPITESIPTWKRFVSAHQRCR